MNILLIHPGTGSIEIAEKKFLPTGAFLPPLGLLYLSSVLINHDHNPEVIDCTADPNYMQSIKNSLSKQDVIGLTVYSQPEELDNSIKIAHYIKKIDPSIPIIIGGPQSSLLPEMTLSSLEADICVIGNGTQKIIPILESLHNVEKLSKIPNIYYRKGKKIIRSTVNDEQKLDVNSFPYPSRHLVDKYEYGHLLGVKISKGKLTSITTSQGCSSHCRFCNLRAFIKSPRIRSIQNITDEITNIHNQGYKTLVFVDDNFMLRKDRVEQIMDFIISNSYDFKLWIFGARADAADRNLWEKMKKAGVEFVSFGFESGDQRVLDYYNKRLTLEKMKQAIHLSNEMGFFIETNYIIGAPIETRETIQNTIDFARKSHVDSTIFYLFTYTYKSPIWKEAVEQGKFSEDTYRAWPDKRNNLGNFTREELMDFITKANKRFYINPAFWFRENQWALFYQKPEYIKLGWRVLKSVR